MTASTVREHSVHIPPWFMGIVDKYVPDDARAHAIHDYAVAHARRPLTMRQRQVFDYIAEYIAEHGCAPTDDEIKETLGFSSSATVWEHLTNLQRKNWIQRGYNKARAITLVEVPR